MSNRSAYAKVWHATIAVLVVLSFLVQLWIAYRASATPRGHAAGTLAGTSLGGRILRVLSFFTIQSNILSAVVSAQLARDPQRDGPAWRALRSTTLLGITVTGVVYGTVLAKVHEPSGWQQVFTNTVFHYIVPIMMVLGWLLFGPRRRICPATIGWSLLWPLAWLVYTLIRGASTDWYPYPFLDVITHGYARVSINSVGVLVVFFLVTTVFWLGDRALPPTDPVLAAAEIS
ncbi:MAG: hypothetical protein JWN95_4134 [Frankiales bacterium]|nr:hypothetical protein [Frankiales bacterium]